MKRKQILALSVVWTLLLWATSATSDYMHYQDGTISICDPSSNWTRCITMQDKNLWASEAWTWVDSYWKHYQRWNNHGFLPGENYSAIFPWWESTWDTQVTNCANYWPSLGWYDSNTFIWKKSDWCNPMNDNLRWWANDSQSNYQRFDGENNIAINPAINPANKRWPCEDWYHVPSIWERWTLLKYRAANYTWAWNSLTLKGGAPLNYFSNSTAVGQFQEDFKIPFAGYRSYYDAKGDKVGNYANLWSSSPYVGDGYARYFSLAPYGAYANNYDSRGNAYSVRCFKDSYLSFPLVSITNDSTTTTIWWNEPVTWLPTTMTVTQNTISTAEWKEVLWEVNVNFWSNQTATFSHPVQVNIPVSDYEQVYIKVKHWWSSEYNFDWLTTNSNASCNNWNVVETSNRYNWDIINVVDGYATIYSCAASSFIALEVSPTVAQINLSVIKWALTIWTETWNLNLWEVNVSNNAQTLSWSFGANSFWVEDMKWVESGYYTTISVTDLTWTVAGHMISADNVSLKTAWNEPSYITWAIVNDSKVIFWSAITSWHSGSTPVNYFQRLNTASEDAWRVWKWWDDLQIKVTIPAHTPYDTYRWTITYTLYDLDS